MDAADRTERGDVPSDPPAHRPRASEALRRASGRDRAEWFALLDGWGAPGRPYREIAAWLTDEHELSRWWAQKLIVEYEQARGLRDPGARSDGTFAVSATTTVAVSTECLFEAFVDADLRERWLPDASMIERASRPGRSVRFDWTDGGSRVNVDFTAKGEDRSQVAVQHERLPEAKVAEQTKAYWRGRRAALKALLEGTEPRRGHVQES